MSQWKDINQYDVKLFMAHVIAMGLVKRPNLENYWSQKSTVLTPFFGKYMSRNTFQLLLSNLHIADNQTNPHKDDPRHDKLHKVRPMLDMMKRNFMHRYKPLRELSFDEACCPWKGRLSFKVYNPSKTHKAHIKFFQVCEAASGYIYGFDIYTGETACVQSARCSIDNASMTTKIVMGLLEEVRLLDNNHHVYMDNYYTSVELFEELYNRNTLACGTFRQNRKLIPNCMKVKLKKKERERGDTVFRRRGPLLSLRWYDKRDVYILSTIHEACYRKTGKVHYKTKQPIYKPEPIIEYTHWMGGVDLGDQLMAYYSILRRSVKWWRKLFIHLLNMIIHNAYVLNKKFGSSKLEHDEYRDAIVQYLLKMGRNRGNLPKPAQQSMKIQNDYLTQQRLTGRHFACFIDCKLGAKRMKPSRACHACNTNIRGFNLKTKYTSYWCQDCKKPLCVSPCFEFFHKYVDYKTRAIEHRMGAQVDEDVQ